MNGIIYKITNKVNNKVYVGQTILSLKARWYRHCGYTGSTSELNMAIKLAIHKYGKENFTIEVIEECSTKLLDEREIYWISYYDSYNTGYNCTKGGQNTARRELKLIDLQNSVITLYNKGTSLRALAKQFKVDHATIKHILTINNIKLRATRTYKLSLEERQNIINDFNKGLSRKEIQIKYNISKSYLSLLLNGIRRI